jgi:hypothetical protein
VPFVSSTLQNSLLPYKASGAECRCGQLKSFALISHKIYLDSSQLAAI